jgi:preprotein translocase subunit SecD
MKSWRSNSNGIFCALAVVCLLSGCESLEKKNEKKSSKESTILKLHMEKDRDDKPDQADVPVYRQRPIMVHIDTNEILNNYDIKNASVVDTEGGFAIRIEFDEHGKRVIEHISAREAGKHFVIYAAFPEVRWLAAPRINRRISNGELIFTPDATREEAERIVKGINFVSKRISQGIW